MERGIAQELDDRHERRGTAAGAVEDGDHLGIAVIATRFAPSQPATEPMAAPSTMIHQVSGMPNSPSRMKKVHATTRAMPAAPSRLPVRAVFGLARNFSARMNVTLATSQTRYVRISRAPSSGGPRRGP